jgi:exo-beta-1,3-glucanase (GH17 family)
MPRGRRGCWTCRIRHRRCDESSPECKECSTRSITCHGYDLDPPEWMSNERLLQEELRRIKGAVKENFRRVKTIQNRQLARSTAEAAQASRAKENSRSRCNETTNPTPVGSSATNTIFREAQYLVHYLDYIFPIQYAFYVDAPDQGGRGWLFFLLERSKGASPRVALRS